MKLFPLVFISLLLSSAHAFAQSEPVITPLDYQLNPSTKKDQFFTSKVWKEGNLWHEKIYGHPDNNNLYQDSYYKDESRKIKQGVSLSYYAGGKLKDSGRYENNQQEGAFGTWHEDGKRMSVSHYHNGVIVDTSLWWDNDGHITRSIYADKAGNGSFTEYWGNGKTKMSGQLIAGKNEGDHLVFDSTGIKVMQIVYKADSLVSTVCLDATGKPTTGECVYEKPAEFRGGANGWKRFLEQNLEYPNYAQKKNIQGVVKVQFLVSKTGDVSETKILSSPHESLSKEVLRLMALSPKWKPAIQLNKVVMYRHIQSVTFRLQ